MVPSCYLDVHGRCPALGQGLYPTATAIGRGARILELADAADRVAVTYRTPEEAVRDLCLDTHAP